MKPSAIFVKILFCVYSVGVIALHVFDLYLWNTSECYFSLWEKSSGQTVGNHVKVFSLISLAITWHWVFSLRKPSIAQQLLTAPPVTGTEHMVYRRLNIITLLHTYTHKTHPSTCSRPLFSHFSRWHFVFPSLSFTFVCTPFTNTLFFHNYKPLYFCNSVFICDHCLDQRIHLSRGNNPHFISPLWQIFWNFRLLHNSLCYE